jgi:protocatechuate 3,4-dioxygenase, alpha subunit
MSELTPSQTVGPFLHIGLPWADGPDVVPEGTPGSFLLSGRVLDGEGVPVTDALVETWQADPAGRFAHPDDPRGPVPGDLPLDSGRLTADSAALRPLASGFRGFGRCPTDEQGRFWIRTVKPGPLPTPGGLLEAPHLDVSVFARGLLDRVVTRCYFPDEEAANAADPVLSIVDSERRGTLVAIADPDGYRWDIRLQGPGETVFFDV